MVAGRSVANHGNNDRRFGFALRRAKFGDNSAEVLKTKRLFAFLIKETATEYCVQLGVLSIGHQKKGLIGKARACAFLT